MTKKEEKMKPLLDRIADLERQIDEHQRRISELTVAKRTLVDVLAAMRGEPRPLTEVARKARIPNVKGIVLEIMAAAGPEGRTSAEVLALAAEKAPGITRDTISSVLSRLKSAEALAYDGLRYFDSKHAPRQGEQRPFAPHVRVV